MFCLQHRAMCKRSHRTLATAVVALASLSLFGLRSLLLFGRGFHVFALSLDRSLGRLFIPFLGRLQKRSCSSAVHGRLSERRLNIECGIICCYLRFRPSGCLTAPIATVSTLLIPIGIVQDLHGARTGAVHGGAGRCQDCHERQGIGGA